MANPNDDSLGSGATRIGGNKPEERYQASLGDQSTFGGVPGHDDTMLESDMEIVDLASRYTIEGPLGKGGMGEVLLATDTRLKRKVAIKRVRGEKLQSSVALSRFLTEAQSIASLNHFNIVQVHDYGRDKDGPFLIMEYVDGSSLLDRCHSGAIPIEEAIDITCQLCDGLGRAHELGIIHRDIKPANILLTKDGKPKLTDFGLAKQDTADHGQTMAGAVLGTLDFMPPEQRRDITLTDARSDLWSLAATFYQMVTGRSPKVIRFDRLPPSLTSVLGKALEENKDDRYQSASEFREALLSSTNHTATVSVSIADLGTGECPSCHTKNESHRKFCRECATSLRMSCLSCKVEIPVWDKVCPECGEKQADLVATRRAEMEVERQKAEHECDQFNFGEATRIAKSIASETDSRLQHLKSWADAFLVKVSEEHARQKESARKQYSDAITHRKSFDYHSAIHTLEAIPEELRSREMSQLADTLRKEQDESFRLVKLITERIEKRDLDGLQELLDRVIVLRGNDEDVRRLRSNFDGLVVTRDKAVADASAKLQSSDYLGCLAALQAIDSGLETPKVAELRKTAEQKNKRVLQLRKVIQQAVDGKPDDLRLNLVNELISLVGKDDQLQKLRDQLLTRDKILKVEIDQLVQQAIDLQIKCQFRQAAECLKRIPTIGKTKHIISRIETFIYLAGIREKLIPTLEIALEEQNFFRGFQASDNYQAALGATGFRYPDPEFEQLRQRCKQGVAKQKALAEAARIAERQKASFRETAIIIATLVGVILLIFGLGIYWSVSSKVRAKAIADGIAAQKWEDVLKLDAKNVPALLGRAGVKINQGEPDFADALKTLSTDELSTLPADLISKFPPMVNSIGMSLKLIPAGTFEMTEIHGAPYKVTLTRPYYIGVYEVSQEEYVRVMGTNPTLFTERRSVGSVNWFDAVEFCNRLSELPEEKSAGRAYRLPTDAEFVYACRAGKEPLSSYSSEQRSLPNAWGLHDMNDYLHEWCQDRYADYSSGHVIDPQGPIGEKTIGLTQRMVRGGGSSWETGERRVLQRDPNVTIRVVLNH